jgi:phenylacetate-CoA ligase
MIIVRGTNVYPSAVEAVLREFSEVAEFRILASATQLRLEVEAPPALAPQLADAVRERLLVRPDIAIVPAGTLPRAEMKSSRVVRVP